MAEGGGGGGGGGAGGDTNLWEAFIQNAKNTKLVQNVDSALQSIKNRLGTGQQVGGTGTTWDILKGTGTPTGAYASYDNTPIKDYSSERTSYEQQNRPSGGTQTTNSAGQTNTQAPPNIDPNRVVNSADYGDPSGGQKTWATILAETGGTGRYGGGGDSGGGGIPWEQQINEMYDPAMRLANEAEGTARSEYDMDIANLIARANSERGKYLGEGENLLSDTQSEQDKFNATLQGALSQALRSYNALQQQKSARFGGGSSAGQAVGELAQQEYFRQQGAVGQKGVEGTQEFAKERGRIKQFISQKVGDLDMWKQEALTEAKKNLNATLQAIASRKGDIEANKTRDKLAALQNAMAQTQAIQQQDKAFRQNLALAAVNQMQTISGRAFTPAEIKAYIQEFTSELPGSTTGTTSPVAMVNTTPKSYEDELDQLKSIQTLPSQQQSTLPGSTPTMQYQQGGQDLITPNYAPYAASMA